MTLPDILAYPEKSADRDAWIVARRPARNVMDANTPYSFLIEDECSSTGEILSTATIFLTNRECPWRCVMCDLWQNTLTENTPESAIPAQIAHALESLPNARQVKLYNSGSFFDAKAVPLSDYPLIAALVSPFERVIVECHPALVGERTLQFRDLLSGRLEVAMGLETVHPQALEKLNKRMTTAQYRSAANFLRSNDIDLRAFVMAQPPFIAADEALKWAECSIDFALDCGATAVTIIPSRAGNGAMEALQAAGEFAPPSLAMVEAIMAYGLERGRGRIFVDLWDIARIAKCTACREQRVLRLEKMNRTQRLSPSNLCAACGGGA